MGDREKGLFTDHPSDVSLSLGVSLDLFAYILA